MKGKFEDKLAQFAFGELSSDEAAKLEREMQSDPEALRALALYKDMRVGLRSLSEVPEDQFSKERLRDAILTQGLRPVPTRPVSNRSWLWMPAAACVLGFALMSSQNSFRRSSAAPNVVIGMRDLGVAKPNAGELDIKPIVIKNPATPAIVPPKPKETESKGLLAVNSDPEEVDHRVMAVNLNDEAYDPDLGKMPTTTASVTAGTVAAAPVRKVTAAAVPIVLIDQDTDEQTGACKATEVGSSSNVLVGG